MEKDSARPLRARFLAGSIAVSAVAASIALGWNLDTAQRSATESGPNRPPVSNPYDSWVDRSPQDPTLDAVSKTSEVITDFGAGPGGRYFTGLAARQFGHVSGLVVYRVPAQGFESFDTKVRDLAGDTPISFSTGRHTRAELTRVIGKIRKDSASITVRWGVRVEGIGFGAAGEWVDVDAQGDAKPGLEGELSKTYGVSVRVNFSDRPTSELATRSR